MLAVEAKKGLHEAILYVNNCLDMYPIYFQRTKLQTEGCYAQHKVIFLQRLLATLEARGQALD